MINIYWFETNLLSKFMDKTFLECLKNIRRGSDQYIIIIEQKKIVI